MTLKYKKPEAYRMVSRSRKDIVDSITNITTQRTYHYDPYWLCFNVKCYDYDLSLENLLKLFKDQEGDHPGMHNADWLRNIKKRYDEVQEHLWDWGVEDSRRSFCDGDTQGDDMFNHLWDGTRLDLEYGFVGRSGGWLAIIEFEGYRFDRKMDSDLETVLMEMPFPTLQKLYQLVLMLKHDLRRSAVKSSIENNAAFNFFANACADIKQPEEVQLELFRTQQEIEEEILNVDN